MSHSISIGKLSDVIIVELTGGDVLESECEEARGLISEKIQKWERLVDRGAIEPERVPDEALFIIIRAAQVQDEILLFLSRIPNLRLLEFRDAKLPQVAFDRLSALAYLRVLALRECDAELTAPEREPPFPQLTSIYLEGPQIRDETIAWLPRCPKLEHVSLARSMVTEACCTSLGAIDGLTSLSFRNTRISDETVRGLASCKGLSRFCLDNVPATDQSAYWLSTMNGLTDLDVAGTSLTASGILTILEKCDSLRRLYVGGLIASIDEREALRARFPHVRIENGM